MEQRISTVSTIHRRKGGKNMDKICFLAMTLVILVALVIVLLVVLKDGIFNFSLKKDKKKDALTLKAEHRHKDK